METMKLLEKLSTDDFLDIRKELQQRDFSAEKRNISLFEGGIAVDTDMNGSMGLYIERTLDTGAIKSEWCPFKIKVGFETAWNNYVVPPVRIYLSPKNVTLIRKAKETGNSILVIGGGANKEGKENVLHLYFNKELDIPSNEIHILDNYVTYPQGNTPLELGDYVMVKPEYLESKEAYEKGLGDFGFVRGDGLGKDSYSMYGVKHSIGQIIYNSTNEVGVYFYETNCAPISHWKYGVNAFKVIPKEEIERLINESV